ncbi:MAG: glpQ1 [Conexibacter sp.]|nr:glpQ1 [Conexibacter sp.]
MTTRVIAHRGASAGTIDNSLDAFEQAIAAGADMIEFDVRRTRDDQLIVFHDGVVRGRALAGLTREEVGAATGHLPPLAAEVLDLARGRIGVDVELKEDGYVERILEASAGFGADDLVVTSFLDRVVGHVKQLAPDVRTGLLVGIRLSELSPTGRAMRCGADLIAMHFQLAALGALRRADEAGFPVFVWTVNGDAQLRRLLADPRVAAIITDVPERALALRDEEAAA